MGKNIFIEKDGKKSLIKKKQLAYSTTVFAL